MTTTEEFPAPAAESKATKPELPPARAQEADGMGKPMSVLAELPVATLSNVPEPIMVVEESRPTTKQVPSEPVVATRKEPVVATRKEPVVVEVKDNAARAVEVSLLQAPQMDASLQAPVPRATGKHPAQHDLLKLERWLSKLNHPNAIELYRLEQPQELANVCSKYARMIHTVRGLIEEEWIEEWPELADAEEWLRAITASGESPANLQFSAGSPARDVNRVRLLALINAKGWQQPLSAAQCSEPWQWLLPLEDSGKQRHLHPEFPLCTFPAPHAQAFEDRHCVECQQEIWNRGWYYAPKTTAPKSAKPVHICCTCWIQGTRRDTAVFTALFLQRFSMKSLLNTYRRAVEKYNQVLLPLLAKTGTQIGTFPSLSLPFLADGTMVDAFAENDPRPASGRCVATITYHLFLRGPQPLVYCHQCKTRRCPQDIVTCADWSQIGLGPDGRLLKTTPHFFCTRCLYNRYKDTAAEVLRNRSWKCYLCQGICNCGGCRSLMTGAGAGGRRASTSNAVVTTSTPTPAAAGQSSDGTIGNGAGKKRKQAPVEAGVPPATPSLTVTATPEPASASQPTSARTTERRAAAVKAGTIVQMQIQKKIPGWKGADPVVGDGFETPGPKQLGHVHAASPAVAETPVPSSGNNGSGSGRKRGRVTSSAAKMSGESPVSAVVAMEVQSTPSSCTPLPPTKKYRTETVNTQVQANLEAASGVQDLQARLHAVMAEKELYRADLEEKCRELTRASAELEHLRATLATMESWKARVEANALPALRQAIETLTTRHQETMEE